MAATRRTVQNKLSTRAIPRKAVKMDGQQKLVAVSALEAVRLAAKESVIATLQATLDHERRDRAHERDNWRKTLERTQANLLAAQDTPTARAIAGAPAEAFERPDPATGGAEEKKEKRRPWWRSIL